MHCHLMKAKEASGGRQTGVREFWWGGGRCGLEKGGSPWEPLVPQPRSETEPLPGWVTKFLVQDEGSWSKYPDGKDTQGLATESLMGQD